MKIMANNNQKTNDLNQNSKKGFKELLIFLTNWPNIDIICNLFIYLRLK